MRASYIDTVVSKTEQSSAISQQVAAHNRSNLSWNDLVSCRGFKEIDAAYFMLVEPANADQPQPSDAGAAAPWENAELKHIIDLLLACLEGDIPKQSRSVLQFCILTW